MINKIYWEYINQTDYDFKDYLEKYKKSTIEFGINYTKGIKFTGKYGSFEVFYR
jgi:hypothetical protein